MASRKKLEEEIARSKDPVLRKQLQELLDKRNQSWSAKKKKAGEYIGGEISTAAVVLPVAVALVFIIWGIIRLIKWLVG